MQAFFCLNITAVEARIPILQGCGTASIGLLYMGFTPVKRLEAATEKAT